MGGGRTDFAEPLEPRSFSREYSTFELFGSDFRAIRIQNYLANYAIAGKCLH